MHQPCKTCPFREAPVEAGSPEWLIDIMNGLKKGSMDHSCHLTDKHADLFAGRKKKRFCVGFLGMVKNQTGDCISSRAMRAMLSGELKWDKIPTKGVFKTYAEMIRFHLREIDKKVEAT